MCYLDSWKQFGSSLKTAGHDLVAIQPNLVDLVWGEERPAPPSAEVFEHPIQYSGRCIVYILKFNLKIMNTLLKNDIYIL